jgi:autotransporter-associated beta strand protein
LIFVCRKTKLNLFKSYFMNKLYMFPTFLTAILNPKTKDKKPLFVYTQLSEFMKKNYSIFILTCFLFFGGNTFGQTTYTLITSTADLVAGDKYLIVSRNTSGSGFAAGYQNTNNRPQAAITVASGLTISTTPATLNSQTTTPFEFTLGGSTGAWTLYDAVNNTYLRPRTGANNGLQGNATTTNATWQISFSSGAAVMTCENTTTYPRNILRFNSASGSELFACYASGQSDVYLYRAPSATNYWWNGGNGTNNTNNIWDLNTTRNWGITSGATFSANTAPGVVWPTSGSYNANFSNTVAGAKTINIPAAISVMPSNTIIGTTDYIFVPSVTQTFSSPVKLDQTLTVAPATGTIFTMSGVLSGAGGITQNGAGATLLSGNNTHTGTTTVTSGTIRLGATGTSPNSPLGTTTAGTTVSSGAVLDLNGFTLATAEGLTLNGTGISNGGALINSGAAASYSGAVTLGSNSSIGTTGNITLSGVVSNGFSLTKVGSGTLIFTGANTYTGTTTISNGTLALGAANRISNSSNIILSGGTFSTGTSTGYAETVGTLSLQSNSTIALGTGNHTLTFSASNAVSWASSTVLTITGWTGTIAVCSTGTAGKIFIGNSATSLTAAQLAQIKFTISGVDYPATLLSTGELVPTLKLVVTNPGDQIAGVGFGVTVTATDFNGTAINVPINTGITLTSTSIIGGTTTGTINSGSSTTADFSGVTLTVGTNIIITATASSGSTCIISGTSGTFDVTSSSSPSLAISGTPTNHSSVCPTFSGTPITYTITNGGSVAAAGIDVVSSDNTQFEVSGLSSTTIAASGGTATYQVTFKPSSAGAKSATITVTSTTSGSNSPTSSLTGTGTASVAQAVTTSAAGSVSYSSATLNGNVTNTGTCPTAIEKGFVYSITSTNSNPIVGGSGVTKLAVGTISAGTYSTGLTSLPSSTLYSFKAYVFDGTTYTYGTALTFTTLNALTLSGTLAHGSVCPGSSASPITYTITNNSISTVTGVAVGSSNSEFNVSGLSPTSIAAGATATYQVTFTPSASGGRSASISVTSPDATTVSNTVTGTGTATVAQAVTSSAATSVTAKSATLNGNVTNTGTCPTAIEKGFVYSITADNANPIVGGSGVTKTAVSGITTGTYTLGLTGLPSSTAYSYKAYVFDGTTYTYSTVQTFTTAIALVISGTTSHGSVCPGSSATPITYTITNNGAFSVAGVAAEFK